MVVTPRGSRFVLQRLNPIFDPRIHRNILAVTEHLAAKGAPTPRLVPTDAGEPWLDLGSDDGVWRVTTFVEGATFDRAVDAEQVREAARLLGAFHAALEDLDHEFVGLRVGVHDTTAHLARLRDALDEAGGHRLAREVEPLGEEILARAADLPALPPAHERVCHGDPKLNNVRFAGADGPASRRAVCLVDLDTVGPLHPAYELGDALRSWCNVAGEDAIEARFDLALHAAATAGFFDGLGRVPGETDRLALLRGVEWVSLELAARFAADVVRESYFGFDPTRYPARGEHNLVRAAGQLALHRAVVAARAARAEALATAG
jgi:Ser/Thr protein kinase RdoA (MazF antagonist)